MDIKQAIIYFEDGDLVYSWNKSGTPRRWVNVKKFFKSLYWTIMLTLGAVAVSIYLYLWINGGLF